MLNTNTCLPGMYPFSGKSIHRKDRNLAISRQGIPCLFFVLFFDFLWNVFGVYLVMDDFIQKVLRSCSEYAPNLI